MKQFNNFFAARGEVHFVRCYSASREKLSIAFRMKSQEIINLPSRISRAASPDVNPKASVYASALISTANSFLLCFHRKNSSNSTIRCWAGARYYLFHFTCASTISFFKYINTNNYFGVRASNDFFSLLSQRLRLTSSSRSVPRKFKPLLTP